MHQADMVTVEAESGIGGATDLLRLSPDCETAQDLYVLRATARRRRRCRGETPAGTL